MPKIPAEPAQQAAVQHFLRPRLTAIAPDTAEAVRHAGGWLFDRAMAGWDVTVITHKTLGPSPLRILGVRTDLYEADPRVRRMVLAAAAVGGGEIRLWGEGWPRDFEEAADTVSRRLSGAARAFKAQALRTDGMAVRGGVPGDAAGAGDAA